MVKAAYLNSTDTQAAFTMQFKLASFTTFGSHLGHLNLPCAVRQNC